MNIFLLYLNSLHPRFSSEKSLFLYLITTVISKDTLYYERINIQIHTNKG